MGCSHARPIHHAVPAGMRWGQSRTTQLQPVLVCCARHRCVLTVFCCLCQGFFSSSSLVSPICMFSSLLHFVCDHYSTFSSFSELKLLLKHVFEINVSISCTFVFSLQCSSCSTFFSKKVSFSFGSCTSCNLHHATLGPL